VDTYTRERGKAKAYFEGENKRKGGGREKKRMGKESEE